MKKRFKKYGLLLLASLSLALSGCATYSSRQYTDGEAAFHQQDYHTAFKDLIYSAGYNNTDAQYAVGYMYYYGIGTEQNDYLSRLWLYRSASFGNAKAMAALQALDRAMPNPQMMEQTTIRANSPLKRKPESKKIRPKRMNTLPRIAPPKNTAARIPTPRATKSA
jgi:TPR repeat protein